MIGQIWEHEDPSTEGEQEKDRIQRGDAGLGDVELNNDNRLSTTAHNTCTGYGQSGS